MKSAIFKKRDLENKFIKKNYAEQIYKILAISFVLFNTSS